MDNLIKMSLVVLLLVMSAMSEWESINTGSDDVIDINVLSSDENIVYAITNSGGKIVKSVDGGNSWNLKGEIFNDDESAYSLAVTPQNRKILFIGSSRGKIYRSDDEGETWLTSYSLVSGSVKKLYVSPKDSLIVYGAISKGSDFYFIKSVDGGDSWTTTTVATGFVTDPLSLTVDPRDDNYIYIGGRIDGNGGVTGAAYKSTNGGKSFGKIFSQSGWGGVVTALAVSQADSKIVFIGLENGTVKRSTNGGNSWSDVISNLGEVSSIMTTAANSNIVYAVGRKSVARSKDGGISWSTTELSAEFNDYGIKFTQIRRASGSASQSNCAVAYIASYTHTYKTIDTGSTWLRCDKNMLLGNIRAIATAPSESSTLYVSSWGLGVYRSNDNGDNWKLLPSRGPDNPLYGIKPCGGDIDIGGITVNPDDPETLYLQHAGT